MTFVIRSINVEMKQLTKIRRQGKEKVENGISWDSKTQRIPLTAEKSSSWNSNIFININMTKIILLSKIMQLNYQWKAEDMS